MIRTFQSTFLVVTSLLLFLPGCIIQPPTPTNTESSILLDEDLIPTDIEKDWGLDPRGPSANIDVASGTYNGRAMLENVLEDIFFRFDSYSISPSQRSTLAAAADYLTKNPGDGLLIEGHCDWYGTANYNLALGDRRAKSVRNYLVTLGVKEDRIETLSKGSLEATSGLSKKEAKQDRRCDLIVLQ